MPYALEKLPDDPIILYSVYQGTDAIGEMPAAIDDIIHLLDQQTEKVFLVFDVRTASLGLDELVQAASATARGQNALMHHVNLLTNVFVASDPIMKMAIKGLSAATFGQVRLTQFDTVEEALSYCRRNAGRLSF